MRTLIDAWVERPDPRIRLLDADTGEELVRWGPEQVRAMLEEGALWLPDLVDEGLGSDEWRGQVL